VLLTRVVETERENAERKGTLYFTNMVLKDLIGWIGLWESNAIINLHWLTKWLQRKKNESQSNEGSYFSSKHVTLSTANQLQVFNAE